MVEGTEHGRNRKTHGLKSKLEKLCGTSFFHLSSHDCEILCEAARALGVFCAFSVYYQDCMTGCWRLSSFLGSPPLSLPPPSGHPWGASENCSSQSSVRQALWFVLQEPASSTGPPGPWQSFRRARVFASCLPFSQLQSPTKLTKESLEGCGTRLIIF